MGSRLLGSKEGAETPGEVPMAQTQQKTQLRWLGVAAGGGLGVVYSLLIGCRTG